MSDEPAKYCAFRVAFVPAGFEAHAMRHFRARLLPLCRNKLKTQACSRLAPRLFCNATMPQGKRRRAGTCLHVRRWACSEIMHHIVQTSVAWLKTRQRQKKQAPRPTSRRSDASTSYRVGRHRHATAARERTAPSHHARSCRGSHLHQQLGARERRRGSGGLRQCTGARAGQSYRALRARGLLCRRRTRVTQALTSDQQASRSLPSGGRGLQRRADRQTGSIPARGATRRRATSGRPLLADW